MIRGLLSDVLVHVLDPVMVSSTCTSTGLRPGDNLRRDEQNRRHRFWYRLRRVGMRVHPRTMNSLSLTTSRWFPR